MDQRDRACPRRADHQGFTVAKWFFRSLLEARETVKTVTFLASVLMSLALVIGCADRTEQRRTQVQNELEQVLRTALRDDDIWIQRAGDYLTVVIAERLLFDPGSQEIKPDGIEVALGL